MATKTMSYSRPPNVRTGEPIEIDYPTTTGSLDLGKGVDEGRIGVQQLASKLETRDSSDRESPTDSAKGDFRSRSDTGCTRSHRRLLCRADVIDVLQLPEEKVDHLVATRQLTPFRLAGEERYDSRDLDRLIDTYITTASRRA
jgi:hypothetical protein